jgi:hypothetical protein
MLRSVTVVYDMFMTCSKYLENNLSTSPPLWWNAAWQAYVTGACHNRRRFMTAFVTVLSYLVFTLLQSFPGEWARMGILAK